MRTLYLDCQMGAAGDMLSAALLELLPDPEDFMKRLNALGLPGVQIEAEDAESCGIRGTHFRVTVNGEEEESPDVHLHGHTHSHEHTHDHMHAHDHAHTHSHTHDHAHDHAHSHDHAHDHAHTHPHTHTGLHEITHLVQDHMALPEAVKKDVLDVYGLIAEAEAHAHGKPVSEIHFHEVGTLDAVADITAVCLLMHEIAPDEVIASPVHVGSGSVRCAHGILPVPAPATAWILKEVPIYGGRIEGELCTPTGAALLKHFVTRFGPMPVMKTESIGYGMGKKEFEAANCVRAMLGTAEGRNDEVLELSCNVDDMTAEAIGFATEQLLDGGALDVYTTAIGMKKNRPATKLSVLCREEDREAMITRLFRFTTTIGIRENRLRRYVLERREELFDTQYGEIRRKISTGYGVTRIKPEYEDLAQVAAEQGVDLDLVRRLADAQQ